MFDWHRGSGALGHDRRSSFPPHKSHTFTGYTLIELLITVVILGVLTALAVPAFNQNLQSARRADARVALLQISNEMEKFYSNNLEYTSDLSELGFNETSGEFLSPDGYYLLSVATDAGKYLVTAHAKPGSPQASDTDCSWFSLDSIGAEDASGEDCW
jgi:type IV pilus assembly protein PilE